MQLKRKALFIINPISGGKKKDGVPQLIGKHLDAALFEATIVFTEGVAHAKQVAAEAIGKYEIVVAVGGDGTVNEVASALVNSEAVLGIVPCGSGNGLSRFLGISMDIKQSIEMLNAAHVECIDSAEADGAAFFNMAGVGFDAHISEVFSHGKKRGFITYIKSSILEIIKYKPQTYYLEIDGIKYERTAFMLSFANSSQYGNNAHVSPKASVQDGLIDVCIIKPFSLWRFPALGLRMFNKTADRSRFVEIIEGKHIKVRRNEPGPMHLDGEPRTAGTDIEINIKPNSLKVIVGESFKK
jgi:diacylglycerol kinase (ATP)